MKTSFKIALLSAGIFAAAQVYAQDHNVGHQIGHTATKVGHKTSEIAAKGAAAISDKRYSDHWGPRGEAVYIDSHSRYFYVNKMGHRYYLKKAQIHHKHSR